MSISGCTPSTQYSEPVSFSICAMDLVYNPVIFGNSKPEKKIDETKRYKTRGNITEYKKNKSESACCICGTPDLVISCSKRECRNFYHLNCLEIYYPSLNKEQKSCPEHSFKNLKEISRLLLLSSKFNSDSQLKNMIKSTQMPKNHQDVLGKLFWFGISQQYFPNVTLKTPNFYENDLHITTSFSTDSWIQQELNEVSINLSTTTQKITEIIAPIQKSYQNNFKKLKTLDYPPDPLQIPINIKKKFIKNYEKLQLSAYFYEKKDYHNITSEEKIICAVCDEGEYTENNLIVICHKCQVPVHRRCYNIKKIPKKEWLCNYCAAKDTGRADKKKQCELCPIEGGALKKIKGNVWAHVTCSRSLQDNVQSDSELDASMIDKEKFKLKCFECGQKKGACVQCSYGRCATAFHVECRKDLLDKDLGGRRVKFCNILCPNHKASKLSRNIKENEDLTREILIGIGNSLWEKFSPKAEIPEKKKLKEQKERKKKIEMKKKMLLIVKEEKVIVKLYINNKLTKVMKYSNNLCNTIEKTVESKFIEKQNANEKLENLPMKIKKTVQNPEIAILKTQKGDFTIKMKVPNILIEELSLKKIPKHE